MWLLHVGLLETLESLVFPMIVSQWRMLSEAASLSTLSTPMASVGQVFSDQPPVCPGSNIHNKTVPHKRPLQMCLNRSGLDTRKCWNCKQNPRFIEFKGILVHCITFYCDWWKLYIKGKVLAQGIGIDHRLTYSYLQVFQVFWGTSGHFLKFYEGNIQLSVRELHKLVCGNVRLKIIEKFMIQLEMFQVFFLYTPASTNLSFNYFLFNNWCFSCKSFRLIFFKIIYKRTFIHEDPNWVGLLVKFLFKLSVYYKTKSGVGRRKFAQTLSP